MTLQCRSLTLAPATFLVSSLLTVSAQESGAELYQSACAACHGADGSANLPAQVGFDIAIPDFTDCDFAPREPDAD